MLGLIPSGVTGAAQHYLRAIAYLNQSNFAKQIIQDLDNVTQLIGIKIVSGPGSSYVPPYYDDCPANLDGGMIVWDCTAVVNTTDFASNDRQLTPGEASRANTPWNGEQKFGARLAEKIFGPRSREGHISAAVCLLHEMGHATQYLSNPAEFKALAKVNMDNLENLNVNAIEATVVQELRALGKNETARWDYMHQGHMAGGNAWPNWVKWFCS